MVTPMSVIADGRVRVRDPVCCPAFHADWLGTLDMTQSMAEFGSPAEVRDEAVTVVPPGTHVVTRVGLDIGAMLIENVCLTICGNWSVAVTSNWYAPLTAGVPLSVPDGDSVRPVGSAVDDHVTGPVAPFSAKVKLYGVPAVAGGNVVDGAVNESGATA